MDVVKATKGLTTLTPQIVWDQMAMGIPLITSAVFLMAKSFWINVGVSEEDLKCGYPFVDKARLESE
jgi:hypothetical protein